MRRRVNAECFAFAHQPAGFSEGECGGLTGCCQRKPKVQAIAGDDVVDALRAQCLGEAVLLAGVELPGLRKCVLIIVVGLAGIGQILK